MPDQPSRCPFDPGTSRRSYAVYMTGGQDGGWSRHRSASFYFTDAFGLWAELKPSAFPAPLLLWTECSCVPPPPPIPLLKPEAEWDGVGRGDLGG